ncbi:MAG: serine/threonine-protein kinase [Polyangiaceae bacterium]|nr:serine/threonine-protein kinase [Polyangiaceae bacterium]
MSLVFLTPFAEQTCRMLASMKARGSSEESSTAQKQLVSAEAWDQQAAVRAAANRELHADLLGPAVTKLQHIAIFAAICLSLVLLGVWGFLPQVENGGASLARGSLLVGVGLSVVMVLVASFGRKSPAVVHDLGHLYLIGLCFVLGLFRHSEPSTAAQVARQVSPVVIPILAFASLIPAPPKTALLAFLAAAAADPLAFLLVYAHKSVPSLTEILFLMGSPVLAASVGYKISRAVHRLSEGIVKAREVGSYHLVERLGMGGMAEVWRADHRMLARPAAIKLIRPKVLLQHGPKDVERLLRIFAREAQTTASLRSPHTIQVYDFGLTPEGAFFYVMELLNGLDLKTLVEQFGRQPAERVASLMAQVCHSLAEAHDRNFVHRDVKPANIFTCHSGNDYDFVKVLDFGLVMDRHPTAVELEDEQRLVGTPMVMAPEMVRFQAPVDARADLYALGCVGYWLLTGKPVFDATTRHDILVMHAHQKPIAPSKRIDEELHPGLEAVIMNCLEKNPNKRPQSAKELREALAALSFEHPWTPERAELWWKKNRPDLEGDRPESVVAASEESRATNLA